MGIGDEIHDHLVQLVRICPEQGESGRQLPIYRNRIHLEPIDQQLHRPLDRRIERHVLALGWVLPCQGKEVTYNPHTALGGLHNGLHGIGLGVVRPLFVEEVSLHHDDGEGIVELMRHTR
jgi:hypothetical protein